MGWDRSGQRRHKGGAAVLVVCAALHLLVLSLLGVFGARSAFRIPPDPTPLQLRLIQRQTPSTRANVSGAEGVVSPGRLEPSELLAPDTTPSRQRPASPAPNGVGSEPGAVDQDAAAVTGCADEDLVLLSVKERIRCASSRRPLGELPHRAIPTNGPEINGIDLRKRSSWDAAVAAAEARRDGTSAQAALAALQAARPPTPGPDRKFDLNIHFGCKVAFGAGASSGSSGLKCSIGPPPPPPQH